MSGKENKRAIGKHFGYDENGFSALPVKIGNVKLSRFLNGCMMGCEGTFPHGCDNYNQSKFDCRKSWKKHREHQWKC